MITFVPCNIFERVRYSEFILNKKLVDECNKLALIVPWSPAIQSQILQISNKVSETPKLYLLCIGQVRLFSLVARHHF